jgi:cysteine-rich repeat protein
MKSRFNRWRVTATAAVVGVVYCGYPLLASAQCIAPPSGLTSWWAGDGSSVDGVNGHNAVLTNGAAYGTGIVNQAFSLDGVNDFVNVPDDPALDVGAGDFTFNAWVNFDSVDGIQIIAEKYIETLGPGVSGWTFLLLDGALQLYTANGSANSSGLGLTASTWNHFTARRTGNTLEILLNGTVVASGSTSGSLDTSSSLKLGHRGNPVDTPGSNDDRGYYLDGAVDEAQLFVGRALSDIEVQAIVDAGSDGQCPPPPVCGDGIQGVGEACDDGNVVAGDGCENDCTLSCGNGVITGTEICDDNNLVSGDGCDENCTPTGCGNNVVTAGEECDDGDIVSGNGCDSNCTVTSCGNGIRTSQNGEACDDGNTTNGDGCEDSCTYTPVSENLPPGGGTVTTDPNDVGATPEFPTQISLTTNNGGLVAISTASSDVEVDGVQLIGITVEIEAPAATTSAPLEITFTVDASVIPSGVDLSQLQMVRDHVPFDDCIGPGVADPDPCLASLVALPSGDVEIAVLSSHASLWQLGVRGQNKDERKCVNAMNSAGLKVAKAQAKAGAKCVKEASKGDEADAQACLTADRDGKVAKVTLKTSETAAEKCAPPPPFAFTGAAAVNTAGQAVPVDLIADIFGANLTPVVISSDDKAGSGCQAAVLATSKKIFETKAGLFLKCKKDALSGKSTLAVSAEQLSGCFDTVAADAKGKVAKAKTKLVDALAEKCDGVDLGTATPGACFAAVTPAACIDARAQCHLCRMFNAMDGLAADCDLVDDHLDNASCANLP